MRILHSAGEYGGSFCVAALGMFDGVHIGHQRLIRTAVRLARELGGDCVVCTFDRHPLSLLAPERAPRPLLDRETNLARLAALGADAALLQPFTRGFADMPPEEYLRSLTEDLRARALVIGENYTFGRGGQGGADLVRDCAGRYGYRAVVVPSVMDGGAVVSSSRIRALLDAGETESAQRLMSFGTEQGSAPFRASVRV